MAASTPEVHLLKALIFLLLFANVLPYHRLIPSHGVDEKPPGPEAVPHEITFAFPIDPSQMDGALALRTSATITATILVFSG